MTLIAFDMAIAVVTYIAVLDFRFEGSVPNRYWHAFWDFLPFLIAVHIVVNGAFGLYGQMWRHASIAEARRIVLAGMAAGAVLWITPRDVPNSIIVFGAGATTALFGAVRFQSRLFAFRRSGERRTDGLRVAIVGCGEAAAGIVRDMQRNREAGLVPVVAVDDDRRKHTLSFLGVPVAGGVDDLAVAIARYHAHQVILAVPSADEALVSRTVLAAEAAGVPMKLVPPVSELLGGRPSVHDVRDLSIEDLLGRKQVHTDLDAVSRLLTGKRVLITGGGGSIGSEIARQVWSFAPARLVLVDHDETHLHDAATGLDAGVVQVLADVRDLRIMREVFAEHRPEVVFHAAAHKHVPLLEDHPCEAVFTNVVGTRNVVTAAVEIGAERLVFISTDKAVRPASVMGASKWVGEQLVLRDTWVRTRFCAVRFGNVLGSRGSVIPTFARQIALGGPVTVTHPSMTRFFMSVREAVQLVLQAAVFAEGGEVFMLEMGDPVNIRELAERMIRLSGRHVGTDVPIVITGVRPGEKLVEELRAAAEAPQETPHPSIVRLQPALLGPGVLDDAVGRLVTLADARDRDGVSDLLLRLEPEFTGAIELRDRIDLTEMEQQSWMPSTT